MGCEKLRAFLDERPGVIGRLALAAHLRWCRRCRQSAAERRLLGRQVAQLEDEPVPPALRERVYAAALTAAAAARARALSSPDRPRRRRAMMMRRTAMAVVFVALVAGVAVWRLPERRDGVALADVARAMAGVTSAHFVGWQLDPATGGKHRVEGWVEGASKLRLTQEGASDLDVADNGERTVTLRNYNGVFTAWVEPPRRAPGFKSGMPYLEMLVGGEGLTSMLEAEAYMVESVTVGSLPDGNSARVITLRHMDGGKAVLMVDARSDLVARWETYDQESRLIAEAERFEYNLDIPDSTFEITIPQRAPVIDGLTPASPDMAAAHKAEEAKLSAAGWEPLSNFDGIGMCGTPYHQHLRFQALDRNGFALFYRRDRNVYYVVGRALVFLLGGAFSQVVEEAEVQAPGPPHLWVAPFRDVRTKADEVWEELECAGGKPVLKVDQGGNGGSCGSPYHSKLHFEVLRDDGCVIAYMPDRNVYRVFGKVRVFGMGLDEVVENGEIEAPAPPDGTDQD